MEQSQQPSAASRQGAPARSRRPSGRDAKIAARTARSHAFVPYITRQIPYYEVLGTGGVPQNHREIETQVRNVRERAALIDG